MDSTFPEINNNPVDSGVRGGNIVQGVLRASYVFVRSMPAQGSGKRPNRAKVFPGGGRRVTAVPGQNESHIERGPLSRVC